MGRTSKRLSALDVKAKSEPGRYADGDGLYLNVAAGKSKSWVFLWMKNGKRREMGLGSYPTISLVAARQRAEECRRQVAEGLDPIAERKKMPSASSATPGGIASSRRAPSTAPGTAVAQ